LAQKKLATYYGDVGVGFGLGQNTSVINLIKFFIHINMFFREFKILK